MELTLKYGEALGDVVIQVDNTVAENKNNILLGTLAAMVDRGIMTSATLCFMMVGHTHIEIDQIFSCFSRAVKGRNIFTREQLGDTFKAAYKKVPVRWRTLENLGNFKDLSSPLTRKVYSITSFQAFLITREGSSLVVRVKKKMHDDNWLGFSEDGKPVGYGAGLTPWRLMHKNAVRLEATPDYELKTVPPEVIRQIEIRQQASWTKLPAAFPGDSARQELVKSQHADSLRILRLTGFRPFPLDTSWLPLQHEESESSGSDDDEGDGGGSNFLSDDDSDDNSSFGDDFDGDERLQQQQHVGRQRRQGRRSQEHQPLHGALLSYAFLLSEGFPFVMGKVIEHRVVDGQDEVYVHWHTPTRKALVEKAAAIDFDVYAGASFAADYTLDHTNTRVRGRPKLVPDASWEQVASIVATCSTLIGGGKKIPAFIKQALASAEKIPSTEEDRSGGAGAGGGDGFGAGGGQNKGKERLQHERGEKQTAQRQQEGAAKNNDDHVEQGDRHGEGRSTSRGRHGQAGKASESSVHTHTPAVRTSARGRQPKKAWLPGESAESDG
eukprot:g16889.t1